MTLLCVCPENDLPRPGVAGGAVSAAHRLHGLSAASQLGVPEQESGRSDAVSAISPARSIMARPPGNAVRAAVLRQTRCRYHQTRRHSP